MNVVETDVWGLPYKIVMKKLNRSQVGALTAGREMDIAAELFPRRPKVKWEEVPITDARGVPIPLPANEDTRPFTLAELHKAGSSLPSGKAPGPDSVPNEVLRIFLRENPSALLALFNLCWRVAVFPKKMEEGKFSTTV